MSSHRGPEIRGDPRRPGTVTGSATRTPWQCGEGIYAEGLCKQHRFQPWSQTHTQAGRKAQGEKTKGAFIKQEQSHEIQAHRQLSRFEWARGWWSGQGAGSRRWTTAQRHGGKVDPRKQDARCHVHTWGCKRWDAGKEEKDSKEKSKSWGKPDRSMTWIMRMEACRRIYQAPETPVLQAGNIFLVPVELFHV